MKCRQGFVSNSSSTSFYFVFKEDNFDNCLKVLEKYGDTFNLSPDSLLDIPKVNSQEIFDTIKNEISGVYSIDFLISDVQDKIDTLFDHIKDERKNEIDGSLNSLKIFFKQQRNKFKSKIEKLEKLKEDGFKTYFEIDFGDNHGVTGPVGKAMDYLGSDINLENSEIYVFTEQNR